MDPSKIKLKVPISLFQYPNFDFATQLLQRLLSKNESMCPLFFIFSPNDSPSKTITNAFYLI